jgi:hypothetical protein
MLAQETRNGQAGSCEAKFRGNAANDSHSLLDDLRFNGISTKDHNLRGKRRMTPGLLPGPVQAFCLPNAPLILRWQKKVAPVHARPRGGHFSERPECFSKLCVPDVGARQATPNRIN